MNLRKHTNLIVAIVIGLVLGLLLGMLLFWQLFPVSWTDAHSYDLSPEGKAEYMALVADSFKLDGDPIRADRFLYLWTPEEKQQAIADAIDIYERGAQTAKVQTLQDLAMALGIPLPTEEIPAPPPVEPPTAGIWNRIRIPCLVFVVVLLVLVLAVYAWRALSNRRATPSVRATASHPPVAPMGPIDDSVDLSQEPLGPFVATYQRGEDTYDESFPIEAPGGEFLGECGIGISETLGLREPDKVTAFEVWLFDKSDIRTVTKVLMSKYAFEDEALRTKLAPRGEAVVASPGASIVLETSGLIVQVDVVDLIYGEGELPPKSFFDKLVVEMVATAKPAESDTITVAS